MGLNYSVQQRQQAAKNWTIANTLKNRVCTRSQLNEDAMVRMRFKLATVLSMFHGRCWHRHQEMPGKSVFTPTSAQHSYTKQSISTTWLTLLRDCVAHAHFCMRRCTFKISELFSAFERIIAEPIHIFHSMHGVSSSWCGRFGFPCEHSARFRQALFILHYFHFVHETIQHHPFGRCPATLLNIAPFEFDKRNRIFIFFTQSGNWLEFSKCSKITIEFSFQFEWNAMKCANKIAWKCYCTTIWEFRY